MTTFHPAAEATATTCVSCDTELETNGKEPYTCGDCERPMLALGTRIGPCEEVSVERDGVTLTKSIAVINGEAHVEYTLTSTRSERVQFSLTDYLKADVAGEGHTTPVQYRRSPNPRSVSWWVPPAGEVQFRRPLPDRRSGDRSGDVLPVSVVPQFRVEGSHDSEGSTENGTGENTNEGATAERTLPRKDARTLIAVPAHNEAAGIADVVSSARSHADAVLVVDDGSTDDTSARAWEAGAFVRRHDSPRGRAAAIQTIFTQAATIDADHLAVLDSDGRHSPDDIPEFIEAQRERGAEIVIGARSDGERETDIPWIRRGGRAVTDFLMNTSLGSAFSAERIDECLGEVCVYDQRAITSLAGDEGIGTRTGVSDDIFSHARQRGYDVVAVDPTGSDGGESVSGHGPRHRAFRALSGRIPSPERDRPLSTLGAPGFLLTVGSVGLGSLLVGQYWPAGVFDTIVFFGALVVTVLGFFTCVTGVLLYALRRYHEDAAES